MSKRFSRRRWRRPERMTLEHPPVQRRKDLGVSEAIPVEAEIGRRRSRRRLEVLLLLFLGSSAAQGALIAVLTGWGWLVPVGFVLFAVLYFLVARELGDGWMAKALRARAGEAPRIARLTEAEAATAGIVPPRVLLVGSQEPNACSFALRHRWLVCTEGCEELDELTLEGMIAHEIVHVRDGEATVAALYALLAGGPELVMRRAGVLCLLSIPLWPVALGLRLARGLAFPEDRQHRADIAAAMLTRYPPGVAAAIDSAAQAVTSFGFRPFEAFWFVPPVSTPGPQARERAALLREM